MGILKKVTKRIKELLSRNISDEIIITEIKNNGQKKEVITKSIKTNINKNIQPKIIKSKKESIQKNIPKQKEVTIEESNWSPIIPVFKEGKLRFSDISLSNKLLKGIHETGYQYCTEIQEKILPTAIKGIDIIGKAQTGTGKTAAFLLTIFQRILENNYNNKPLSPRALVIAPTRELAIQIEKDANMLGKYCGINVLAVFGGVPYSTQLKAIKENNPKLLIATPGRILDYMESGNIKLANVEILVLDEADRLMDMGFIPDIRKIVRATPHKNKRQTMLFSATLSQDILNLSEVWTNEPIKVDVEPNNITSSNIDQIAYIVTKDDKFTLLYNILSNNINKKTIIFTNRRNQAKNLGDKLKKYNIKNMVISGELSQIKRVKALEDFRNGKVSVLVATDVASRGIHVDNIDMVFNYNLPSNPDDYVHRIGRTGRAGNKGQSIAFATEDEAYEFPMIEKYIKQKLNYIYPDEKLLQSIPSQEVIVDFDKHRNI